MLDMTEGKETGFSRVLISGLGLIGGSLAMALRDLGGDKPEIIGVDPDPYTRKRAADGQLVDLALDSDDPRVDDLLSEGGVDLVVLAMPPASVPPFLERISRAGYTGVVTDTASTKEPVCMTASEKLIHPEMFIPGHPMAGSEMSGLDAASADLFRGRYWILCPDDASDGRAYLGLHSLVTSIGARCITVDRHEHDSMVAVISHIPHVSACALVELASRRSGPSGELFRLASGGFRDSTRIASGSPHLWTDILMGNSEEVAGGLRDLVRDLEEVATALESGDSDALAGFLERSSEARRALPAAWIPNSDKMTSIRISMSDGVGVIAGVTSAAGRCGCNIQSIGIEHLTDDTAILELLLTDEGALDAFIDELADLGYRVVGEPMEVQS